MTQSARWQSPSRRSLDSRTAEKRTISTRVGSVSARPEASRLARRLAYVAAFSVTWNNVRVHPNLTFSDAFLAMSAALILLQRGGRAAIGTPNRHLATFAKVLLVGGLAGAAFSHSTDFGQVNAARFAIAVFTILLVVDSVAFDRARLECLAVCYVAGALANGLISLLPSNRVLVVGRAVGLTTHPNHLGFAMLLALWMAIGLLRSVNRRIKKVALTSLPILVATLLASGSRAALGGVMIGGLTLVLLARSKGVPWILWLCLAIIPILAGPAFSGSITKTAAVQRFFDPTSGEAASNEGRLAYFVEAKRLISGHPIAGVGFSNALKYHSVPLQLMVIGGLFGIVALFMLGRQTSLTLRMALRPSSSLQSRASASGFLATMAVLMISNSLFDRYFLMSLALWALPGFFDSFDRLTDGAQKKDTIDGSTLSGESQRTHFDKMGRASTTHNLDQPQAAPYSPYS
jgi:O-antigen ligase